MKKLISVFAALALVGSLAAQRGKKPAAKPAAKPVVAAPAVPAAAATVAAVAPAKSGAGIGLFIEGFGGYTMGMGSSDTVEDGKPATVTNDTVRTNKSQNPAGLHFGGNLGYQIVENLGLVAGFHYRELKGREYSNTDTGGSWTRQTKNSTGIITLGIRPSVNALGGQVYAGFGWAVTLPFTETTNFTNTSNYASFTAAGDKIVRESKYNLGLKGVYAEVGYNYNITSSLYVGVGLRGILATTDNIDQTQVDTTTTSAGTTTSTTTFKESTSVTATNAEAAGNTATATKTLSRAWSTKGVTEIGAQINIGFRF